MIPMPNVIAGVLVGLVNDAWVGVLTGSALVWPLIFCVYVSLVDSRRVAAVAEKLESRVKAYLVEFCTASLTALPVASIVYLVRSLLGG